MTPEPVLLPAVSGLRRFDFLCSPVIDGGFAFDPFLDPVINEAILFQKKFGFLTLVAYSKKNVSLMCVSDVTYDTQGNK